jgi:hypothetical protein
MCSQSRYLAKTVGYTDGPRISFDMIWTAQKTTPATILRCRWNVFTKPLPSKDGGIHRRAQNLLWYDMDRTENDPTILLVLHLFNAAGTCLPSRCLAAIGGCTYRHRLMEGTPLRCVQVAWYTYQVMGLGIKKLMRRDTYRDTHRLTDSKTTFIFFQYKERRLKSIVLAFSNIHKTAKHRHLDMVWGSGRGICKYNSLSVINLPSHCQNNHSHFGFIIYLFNGVLLNDAVSIQGYYVYRRVTLKGRPHTNSVKTSIKTWDKRPRLASFVIQTRVHTPK